MAGPGGVSTGVKATVKVIPDTSKFVPDLQKYIQRIEHSLKIELPTTLDLTGALKDLDELKARTDGTTVQLKADVESIQAEVRAQVEEATKTAPPVHIKADVDRKLSSQASALTTITGQLATSAARVGAAVITWGPPIVAALAAAVALAPAFAITLPLVAGLGAAVGAVALSMSALKKTFAPLGKAILALKGPVSAALTEDLAPIVKSLATNLVPALRSGLVGMAKVLNAAAQNLLSFVASSQGVALIKQLFDGMAKALTPLATAVTPLTQAFLQLGVAALPGLQAFSQGLANLIVKFADFVDAGTKSGDLSRNISAAVSSAGALLRGFGNFLGPLTKGLAAIGPSVLTGLGNAFTAVGQAITFISAKVQQLAPAFQVAGAQLQPFAALFQAVIATVKQQVAFFVQVFQQLGPSLAPFFQLFQAIASTIASSIGPAFAFLRSALQPVIAGFQQFLQAVGPQLLPTFNAIKTAVAAIVPTLQDFATKVGSVLGPGIAQIGQIIATDFLPAFRSILPVVTPVLNFLLKILGSAIVGALQGAINVIKGLLKVISGIFNVFAGIFTGDWSKVWQGIKQIFSGAFTAIVGAIQVFLNVGVLKAFRAGWAAAEAIVKGVGPALLALARGSLGLMRDGVVAGAKLMLEYWRNLPGLIVRALGKLGSLLLSAGRDLVRGFIAGIKAMAGEVFRVAAGLAAQAVDAVKKHLHIASPSRVMIQLGRYVTQGFALGILKDANTIKSAATTLTQKITDAVASYGKQKDTIAARIDRDRQAIDKARQAYEDALNRHGKGAAVAVRNAKQRVADAVAKLASDKSAAAALKDSFGPLANLTSSQLAALNRYITSVGGKLASLAKQRSAVADQLDAANSKLQDAIKLRDDYARQVSDATKQFASILTEAPEGFSLTADNVIANLQAKLEAIKQFRTNLDALKSEGLSDAALKQLVDAGVEAGSATAAALAAGGQAAVDQVNSLTKAIGDQADQLGQSTASQFFQAGVDAAQGLVDGLKSQQAALQKQMEDLADTLVSTIKKKLKIKSPSKVTHEIGGFIVQGLANGMDASTALVSRMASRVSGLATPAVGDFAAAGSGVAAAGGVNVYVTNPVPETASESTTRIMRRLSLLGAAA